MRAGPGDGARVVCAVAARNERATAYIAGMLNPTAQWRAFERDDEVATYGRMSYSDALARFERLWRHARAMHPDVGEDWEEDIAADLAVARAVNGLPPLG